MSSEEKTTISNPPSVREKETFSVDDVEARDAKATAEFDLNSTEEQKQQHEEQNGDDEKKQGWFGKLYSRFRPLFHLGMFLIFTGYLAAAYALQVPKGYDQEQLILGLIYAFFCLIMLFKYIPFSWVTTPMWKTWDVVATPVYRIPRRWRMVGFGFLDAVVIIVTIFSIEAESTRVQRLIALFGMFVFISGLYITSRHRRSVNWSTVWASLLLQFLLALFVFRTSVGQDIFKWLSTFAQGYLGKAWYGIQFLTNDDVANAPFFAVTVFPAIIFFASTVQILYYVGALQWMLTRFAVIFVHLLQVSGAEAIVAVASPFIGQGENALLVKPYLPYMTQAELHQVMTSGFATISGSVLFGYMAMGVEGDSLLTSCIMSIPCSLAVSKLRVPETEEPLTGGKVRLPPADPNEKPANLLHAAGNGANLGMTIVLCIAANLIALLSLLYAVNAFLTWAGNFLTIQELTLQLITGYVFVPIAWMIGADNQNLVDVGRLMALKIWANEFVAYKEMTTTYKEILTPRSKLVATYALCGFANLSSIGNQIGCLTVIAPGRAAELSKLAVSAMLCGAISTWISACIAGMLE